MQSTSTYWDLLSPSASSTTLLTPAGQEQEARFEAQFARYQQNPNQIKWIMALCIILPAILFYFLVILPGPPYSGFLEVLLFLLLPAVIYYSLIQQLEGNLVRMLIAKQNGWLYAAEARPDRWKQLAQLYPETFNLGDNSQLIKDEFWGVYQHDQQTAPFWMGTFKYTIGQGKNSQTYTKALYAFKLPHSLTSDFQLEPQSFGTKLGSIFDKNHLTTESNQFNQLFAIEYRGQKSSEGAQIYQALNPVVQEKLIAFEQAMGQFELLIRNDVVLLKFPTLLAIQYTNFLHRVSLDPRDIQAWNDHFNQILQLTTDILPYLE